MDFDRAVLPKDGDRDETYPWIGMMAILIIVGGRLKILFAGLSGEAVPPEISPVPTRVRS